VGVRQGAGAGALVVHAAYGRATPVGELLPLQPAGDRRVWELGLRLEW
jgi:hypothetical protein